MLHRNQRNTILGWGRLAFRRVSSGSCAFILLAVFARSVVAQDPPLDGASPPPATQDSTDPETPEIPPDPALFPTSPGGAQRAPLLPALPDIEIDTRVTYTIADGIFVEIAADSPVRAGMVGWLEHQGTRIARIEVGQVATRSAFLRVVPRPRLILPRQGQPVRVILEAPRTPEVQQSKPSPTVKDPDTPDAPFEPLLGPYFVDAETRNLFNGRASIRQFGQATSNELLDYSRSHFDTAGSLERVQGTPWALEWSAEVIYRDGDALENQPHYQDVWTEFYKLSLTRRFDSKSIARVGRFLPAELPSAGYLDGAQGELVLGPFLRVGGMLGLKPKRDDLAVSGKEPVIVPYATFYWEVDPTHYYSATTGALMSLYEGKYDRFALLLDQQATIDRFSFYSTAEVDLDTGSALTASGARLTRFDFTSSYRIGGTTLHGGLNHFSIPDTAAERDALGLLTIGPEEFLDDDTWRYTAGASHALTRKLSLDEQVSFIDSGSADDELLWRVGLTQRGWLTRGSSLSIKIYNLGGDDLDGFGGSINGYFPLYGSRLALLPTISARAAIFDSPDADLEVSDIALRIDWRATDRFSIQAGAIYTDSDDINRFGFDLGITWRW